MKALNFFSIMRVAVMLCLTSILFGCAAVPQADSFANKAAKAFTPKPDKANIYVFRKSGFVGAAMTLQVSLDAQVAGGTGPGTFFWWEVSPGNHVVASQTSESFESLKISADAGRNYFIEQSSRFGVAGPRVSLRQVGEAEGCHEVNKCALIPNAF